MKPTNEMKEYFELRTNSHINIVQLSMFSLINKKVHEKYNLNKINLISRADIHDKSKFGDVEYTPYVWLTEFYRAKNNNEPFSYPDGMEDLIFDAWIHHSETNPHHPEYYHNCIRMSEEDMVEMVCDWNSMSQEYNQSLKKWVDENIDRKWKFNKKNKKFIYEIVEILEQKLNTDIL